MEDISHNSGGIKGPIGLGFRVPLLVLSPFSRGGFLCSDTFDHTSLLRFLETRFGAEVPNLERVETVDDRRPDERLQLRRPEHQQRQTPLAERDERRTRGVPESRAADGPAELLPEQEARTWKTPSGP